MIIWSVLETFTAFICASLMCFRPLIVKLLPSIFHATKNESRHTPNPVWGQLVSVKLGSKLRDGNSEIELCGIDDEARGGKGKNIRVQTTLVVETTIRGSEESEQVGQFGRLTDRQRAFYR